MLDRLILVSSLLIAACYRDSDPPEPSHCEACRGDDVPNLQLGSATPLGDREAAFLPVPDDGTVELWFIPGGTWLMPLRVDVDGICRDASEVQRDYLACTGSGCSLTMRWETSRGVVVPHHQLSSPPLCPISWDPGGEDIELVVTVRELPDTVCGTEPRSVTGEFRLVPECPEGDTLCQERCFHAL